LSYFIETMPAEGPELILSMADEEQLLRFEGRRFFERSSERKWAIRADGKAFLFKGPKQDPRAGLATLFFGFDGKLIECEFSSRDRPPNILNAESITDRPTLYRELKAAVLAHGLHAGAIPESEVKINFEGMV
jgi:hypothetical protein